MSQISDREPLLCPSGYGSVALPTQTFGTIFNPLGHVAKVRNDPPKAVRLTARNNADLLRAFLEHIPDGVYFKDRESRFVCISRSLAARFGLSDPAEAIHKTDSDMFSAEHARQALADEQEIMRTGQALVNKEEKETWPDGRETWVLTTKLPLVDGKGTVIGTMGISREITERKRVEQELQEYRQQLEELVRKRTAELARANELLERDIAARRIVEEELTQKARELAKANAELQNLSLTDPLTGLYNRRGFMALMEHRIRLAARTEESFSIGFLDLDDLKQINDSFGHQEGNVALVETANALRDCFRVSDILARVGGDEFALCIADANEEEIAQRIQEQFDRRNAAPGRSYSLAYSVGIVACHPGENWDIEALLARADALMYRQKQSKRRLRNGASSGI